MTVLKSVVPEARGVVHSNRSVAVVQKVAVGGWPTLLSSLAPERSMLSHIIARCASCRNQLRNEQVFAISSL